jgi:MFS family permease
MNHFQLSSLTFFLYFALGAVTPMISLYLLNYLHFSGKQTGLIMSVSAISALVSPLVSSFLADRILPAERLFGYCLLIGGMMMGILYQTHSFVAFLVGYFFYTVAIGPAATLSNAIIFHKIQDRREFGRIRAWGTAGWMVVAWVFGWLWLRGGDGQTVPDRMPDALLLSSIVAISLGLWSFTLPVSVELKHDRSPEFLPRQALAIARRPAFIGLALITLMANITDRFYYYAAGKFLVQDCGVKESNMMPMLTIGQIPEVFAMILLGRLTTRLGLLPVMLMGAACNVARYCFFIFGNGSTPATVAGIFMHGLAYTFFFSTVFILLDSLTEKESRSGVHQLFTLAYSGIGGVLGSWIAGFSTDACMNAAGVINFHALWCVPLSFSLAVFACLAIAARHLTPQIPSPIPEPEPPPAEIEEP